MKIKLNTIADVRDFVDIATLEYVDKLLAKQDGYVVDGKSIMGLFSLDLTRPFEISHKYEDGDEQMVCDDKCRLFRKYIDENDMGELSYIISSSVDASSKRYFTAQSYDCFGVLGGGSTPTEAYNELVSNLKEMLIFFKEKIDKITYRKEQIT